MQIVILTEIEYSPRENCTTSISMKTFMQTLATHYRVQ